MCTGNCAGSHSVRGNNVAHRMHSVLSMDQVVVLGAGEVIEAGVPSQLAKSGGAFASMVEAKGLG